MSELVGSRVLIKFSGEALLGEQPSGIDPQVLAHVVNEVGAVHALGARIGLVVGGGNIYRGKALAEAGMNRVVGDHLGMLATVMNALAIRDALERAGLSATVLSAVDLGNFCELYAQWRAKQYLEQGRVVLFAAGTGNPFFTTDTAAVLRAIEIEADLLIKATRVNGVYTADPLRDPHATRYTQLRYDEALTQELGVMDLTALILARDHGLPTRVLDMRQSNALARATQGLDEGTLVTP